jgi:DNA mismatch repair protein MLH1
MGRCTLSSELLVVDSLVTALNLASSGWTVDDGPVVSIAKEAAKFLMAKAPMLEEYYNIQLVGEGPENFALVTVPVLLDGHLLEPSALPMMLLRLATEVDWDQEQSCFEGIALELAIAYAVLPEATSSLNSLNADEVDAPTEDLTRIATKTQDIVQHSWWPAFRHYLLPPPELSGEITQVACLEKLYKVFERC